MPPRGLKVIFDVVKNDPDTENTKQVLSKSGCFVYMFCIKIGLTSLTQAVSLSSAETTEEPGCSQVKKTHFDQILTNFDQI